MTMYAFFRSIGALVGSLDVATRITGVAIQALIVYTGYLIPPSKMHPWFSWLRWINPVQYGFEGLMANEFSGLQIACDPPFLVPQGPGAAPQYQSCTIQGSQPGQTTVSGDDYIRVAYSYSQSHLWRNFGFILAFFFFFVALTAVGMEIQKPNKGGGAVTIFKRGQIPKSVEKALETGQEADDVEKNKSGDIGAGVDSEKHVDSSASDSDGHGEKVAKNETIFTWQNVNYTIPYKGGERQLLQNIQGFVRPGKLTALMGASGAGQDYSPQYPCTANQFWRYQRRLPRRRQATAAVVPACNRLRRADGCKHPLPSSYPKVVALTFDRFTSRRPLSGKHFDSARNCASRGRYRCKRSTIMLRPSSSYSRWRTLLELQWVRSDLD